MITTWWNREQTATLPMRRDLLPRRGTFGGQCFHPTCSHTGADWFNRLDQRYYCDDHARALNHQSLADGLAKVCELHL
jgi:hypothetical protein